jgi:hypothetical protein
MVNGWVVMGLLQGQLLCGCPYTCRVLLSIIF